MILRRNRRTCFRRGAGSFLLLLAVLAAHALAEEPESRRWKSPKASTSALGSPLGESASGPPEEVQPTEELTLAQAMALALLRSPELAGFTWEVRAQEARALQAGRLPNPELSTLVENLGTGRDEITGGVQTTIQLGQLVELGGKRSARKRVAALGLGLAERTYEIERLNLLSRVSRAFIEVLGAQRHNALAEEIVQLAEQSASAVSERVAAGKVSPVEETKANVALSMARIELDRRKREMDSSRRVLSATWGNTEPHFAAAVGDLDAILPIPALERLTELLSQNPMLSLATEQVSLQEAAVDLAKATRVPDLTVGAGARRYAVPGGDVDALLVGISIPLPLFDRRQGQILAARAEVERAAERRRATETGLEVSLAGSYLLLSSAYSEVKALREAVLPGAEIAFEKVNEGYRLGRFGLLDVLDSQRTLFEARQQYLRAATDYHKAVVDVERLIGDRLDSAEPTQDGDLP